MKNNCKHCGNCKCKEHSITDIKTICQRVKNLYAERVKVVASYGY